MPKVKHDNLDKLGALKDGKDGDKDNGGESSSTPGAGPVLETTLSLRKDGQPQHAGGAAGPALTYQRKVQSRQPFWLRSKTFHVRDIDASLQQTPDSGSLQATVWLRTALNASCSE